MPRGRKKGGKAPRGEGANNYSDDDLSGDAASVVSSTSEHSVVIDAAEDEVDESAAQDNFEDKLKDVIDGITAKSAKGRTEMLHSLRAALSKKYIYDFISDRRVTIQDGLERCLKKGRGEEQTAAAVCVSLLLLQLGASDDSEQAFRELQPILRVILLDKSMSSKARAACAEALGIGSFIAGGELEHVQLVMQTLESVFAASYFKGDGSPPTYTPDVYALHNAAMSAWGLLLSIAPASVVDHFIDSHLDKLPQLLSSTDVELRITAGETIALAYELAREQDEDFDGTDIDSLLEQLKQLATDGQKYRAKKDRRMQRANFRDILRVVQEGEPPYMKVKFGAECMYVDSMVRKRQYDSLCHVLGSGLNVHLQENDLLRDIFGLGAPAPVCQTRTMKAARIERHMFNAAAFKARTKARGKVRDKRTAVIGGD